MSVSIASRPWWPWAKHLFSLTFFAIIGYLMIGHAKDIQWAEGFAALRRRAPDRLALAVLLTIASFAMYSGFDLLGRHVVRHTLKTAQVLTVAFISYAFTLNIGSLMGGLALRYRLYSRFGLSADVITKIAFFSIVTNWLGHALLTGVVLIWSPVAPPASWRVTPLELRLLGVALLLIVFGYLLACAKSRRRTWHVRGHDITLPSLRIALLQVLMASLNWLLMACALYILLGHALAFPLVLGVLFVAAVAGIIVRVPAGLGVLEAVFFIFLGNHMPRGELLGGLLAYRAIYYVAPLLIASAIYPLLEVNAGKA